MWRSGSAYSPGWRAAVHYLEFLLAGYGVPFGQDRSGFGHDIGFYVYWLPVHAPDVSGLLWTLVLSIVRCSSCATMMRRVGVFAPGLSAGLGESLPVFPALHESASGR